MEKISVLMPVYKTPLGWLDESIASILNQTYENFDFIIVNDCAPEEEACRLREWARKDSRIILIEHEENRGCAAALNTGLSACKTSLIARMDSDDRSHPERLQKQVEFFLKNPDVDILGTGYHYLDRPTMVIHPIESNEAITMSTFSCCSMAHPTVMYKRDVVLQLGGYDENVKYAEDYHLWAKAVKGHKVFANLDEDLLAYRTKPFIGNEHYFLVQRKSANEISASLLEWWAFGLSKRSIFKKDLIGSWIGAVQLMNLYGEIYKEISDVRNDELRHVFRKNMREAYKTYCGVFYKKWILKGIYLFNVFFADKFRYSKRL